VKAKRTILQELLAKVGRIPEVPIHPTLAPLSPWNYRARAQLKIEAGGRGLILGFYKSRSHEVVEVGECPLLQGCLNQVLTTLRGLLARDPRLPSLLSSLHEIQLIAGAGEKEVLLYLLGPRMETKVGEFVGESLRPELPFLQGIVYQDKERKEGKSSISVWGQGHVTAGVGGLHLFVSAGSFFQVATAAAEALVDKVLEYAALTGEEAVLDLYAGVGTFTLPLAQRSKRTVGVELDMQAVADALHNLRANGIENCEVWNMAVEEALESSLVRDKWDLVVLDPPRPGLTRRALEGLLRLKPERIIYVSCDPSTLARDLSRFCSRGYRCLEVQPLDLYPQTYHIEAVAALTKRAADR